MEMSDEGFVNYERSGLSPKFLNKIRIPFYINLLSYKDIKEHSYNLYLNTYTSSAKVVGYEVEDKKIYINVEENKESNDLVYYYLKAGILLEYRETYNEIVIHIKDYMIIGESK